MERSDGSRRTFERVRQLRAPPGFACRRDGPQTNCKVQSLTIEQCQEFALQSAIPERLTRQMHQIYHKLAGRFALAGTDRWKVEFLGSG